MSGTRRLIASKLELLADTAIVGPTPDALVLSAPAETLLGNNPAIAPFTLNTVVIPAGSGISTIPITSSGPIQRYFSTSIQNLPYHSRLTSSLNATQARLSSTSGMGLKARATFSGFGSFVLALAASTEITIGIHATDNLGNTWDVFNTFLYYPASAGQGKTFELSLDIVAPHLASRTHIDFTVDSDNPAAIPLTLAGSTFTVNVQQ